VQEVPSSDRFPQLFWGLLALSFALVMAAFLAAGAIRDVRQNDVLTVKGSAKRPIRSDYVTWRVSLSSQQPTLKASYQELKTYAEKVKRYLEAQRLPNTEITLTPIVTSSVLERYPNGQETGKTLAYQLRQSLQLTSNEVDRITTLSRQANELINEGIPVDLAPPEYLYTKLSSLRIEMLAEATKDAKARAEIIAKSTGNRIGVVRSADTGIFQITPRYSTEVSDSGIYDTSSLEKDITAVVTVKFAIE
jgi:uncharacterized protein